MPAYNVHSATGDWLGYTWGVTHDAAEAKARRFFRRQVLLLRAGSDVLDALLAAGVDCARRTA